MDHHLHADQIALRGHRGQDGRDLEREMRVEPILAARVQVEAVSGVRSVVTEPRARFDGGVGLPGLGLGLLARNLNGWLAENAPEASRGRLLGGLTSVIFVGQFCSPLLLRPVVSRVGYAATFLILGGVTFGIGTLAVGIHVYRSSYRATDE